MIDLYTWSTPNGRKVSILLEELGWPYRVHPINITQNAQFAADFIAISPNNKIPALVDRESGQTLMESGAILLYLAERAERFLPTQPSARWRCLEWLMWQMGGLGPMLGQAHHFVHFNPDKSAYAKDRYATEAQRLYGVLDRQLTAHEYVAGAEYSVADMAIWPWIARFEWQAITLADYPQVLRWYRAIAARPAVIRGYSVPTAGSIPLPRWLMSTAPLAAVIHRVVLQAANASAVEFAAAAGRSLVKSARSAGYELTTGCLQGRCAICRARVISGTVADLRRPSPHAIGNASERMDGCVLLCSVGPLSDVVLEPLGPWRPCGASTR